MGDNTVRLRSKEQLYPGPRAFNPISTKLYKSKTKPDHYILEVGMTVRGEMIYHKYYDGSRVGGQLMFREMRQPSVTPAQERLASASEIRDVEDRCADSEAVEDIGTLPDERLCAALERGGDVPRLSLRVLWPAATPLTLSLPDRGVLTFSGKEGALTLRDASGSEEVLTPLDGRTAKPILHALTTRYESVADVTPQYAYEVDGMLLLVAETPELEFPYTAFVKTPTGVGRVEVSTAGWGDEGYEILLGTHGVFSFSKPDQMRFARTELRSTLNVIGTLGHRKLLEQKICRPLESVDVKARPITSGDMGVFSNIALSTPLKFKGSYITDYPYRHWNIDAYLHTYPAQQGEVQRLLERDAQWLKAYGR